MSENTVLITEKDGKYQIENNGIPEFALLGILECIIFEMKSTNLQRLPNKETSLVSEKRIEITEEKEIKTPPDPTSVKSTTPDLRTRIANAVKAIKSLGGKITYFDADNATDEELQVELETLTEQYKRLKNSK